MPPKMVKAVKSLDLNAKDVVIAIGLLSMGTGFWLIDPSLAFISVGLGLFGLGTGLIRIK